MISITPVLVTVPARLAAVPGATLRSVPSLSTAGCAPEVPVVGVGVAYIPLQLRRIRLGRLHYHVACGSHLRRRNHRRARLDRHKPAPDSHPPYRRQPLMRRDRRVRTSSAASRRVVAPISRRRGRSSGATLPAPTISGSRTLASNGCVAPPPAGCHDPRTLSGCPGGIAASRPSPHDRMRNACPSSVAPETPRHLPQPLSFGL